LILKVVELKRRKTLFLAQQGLYDSEKCEGLFKNLQKLLTKGTMSDDTILMAKKESIFYDRPDFNFNKKRTSLCVIVFNFIINKFVATFGLVSYTWEWRATLKVKTAARI
jgi:hypothetical protein